MEPSDQKPDSNVTESSSSTQSATEPVSKFAVISATEEEEPSGWGEDELEWGEI